MEESEGSKAWQSIPVGDDLGTLDYVLTAQMIADYRRVVDKSRRGLSDGCRPPSGQSFLSRSTLP